LNWVWSHARIFTAFRDFKSRAIPQAKVEAAAHLTRAVAHVWNLRAVVEAALVERCVPSADPVVVARVLSWVAANLARALSSSAVSSPFACDVRQAVDL